MRRAKVGFSVEIVGACFSTSYQQDIGVVLLLWKPGKDDSTTAAGDFATKISLSANTVCCWRSETDKWCSWSGQTKKQVSQKPVNFKFYLRANLTVNSAYLK